MTHTENHTCTLMAPICELPHNALRRSALRTAVSFVRFGAKLNAFKHFHTRKVTFSKSIEIALVCKLAVIVSRDVRELLAGALTHARLEVERTSKIKVC